MYAATSTISQPRCRRRHETLLSKALATLFRWSFGGKEVVSRLAMAVSYGGPMLLIKKPSLSTLRHGSPKGQEGPRNLQGAVDKVKGVNSSGAVGPQ
ncbi:hypothetical protein CEXT_13211 [Caerostris extrusa]|uniref:Uncharacterized protein n=1 Tax=Caerostris extrusa TaxID=172846 RepID=A0AAV4RBT1_CAEEX|nr:hypothetical protein CEXT_13211 [Caerostris extrusa]